MNVRRHILFVLTLAMALLHEAAHAADAPQGGCVSTFNEEMLFNAERFVKLSVTGGASLILHDAMAAIEHNEHLYLAIDEFFDSLDFAIERKDASFEGWFLSTDRQFALDIARCRAAVTDVTKDLADDTLISASGNYYVALSQLEAWFPFKLAYDPMGSLVTLRSAEPLPVEKRRHREQQASSLKQRTTLSSEDYRVVPYRFLGWPALDLSTTTQMRRRSGVESNTTSYKVLYAGDVAWMQGRISFYGSDQGGLERSSGTLFRTDDRAQLLGPLQATQVKLGDVSATNDGLVLNSAFGRGLTVSNYALQRADYFDNFELSGELPLGWDLEVYKNGQLVSYKPADGAGRFELDSLTLDYGNNDFTLVYYGPQGQIQEEKIRRVIGSDALRPGQFNYRLNVLRERDDNGLSDDKRATIGVFDLEYGVSRWLSLGGGWRSLRTEAKYDRYQLLHSTISLPGVLLSLDYADELDAGETWGAQLQARLLGGSWTLEHDQFRDYESQVSRRYGLGRELQSRSRVRTDYRTTIKRLRLNFTADGESVRSKTAEKNKADFSLSISQNRSALTLRHNVSRSEYLSSDSFTARQRLLFRHRLGTANIRAEASYNHKPEATLSTAAVSADWRWRGNTRAKAGVTYQHRGSRYSYNFGVNHRFTALAAGLSGSYTQGGDWAVSLSLSTSLGSLGGASWAFNSIPQSSRGAVSAALFLDANGNDYWDEGEDAINGVNVLAGSQMSDMLTDENGQVTVANLPTGSPMLVRPDESQLDPMWKIVGEQPRFKLRPASHTQVQLAVVPTGVLEGHVMVPAGASPRPVAGATIELYSKAQTKKITSFAGYDGYYYIDGLLPGSYTMNILSNEGCFTMSVSIIGGEFETKTILLEKNLTLCDYKLPSQVSFNAGIQ